MGHAETEVTGAADQRTEALRVGDEIQVVKDPLDAEEQEATGLQDPCHLGERRALGHIIQSDPTYDMSESAIPEGDADCRRLRKKDVLIFQTGQPLAQRQDLGVKVDADPLLRTT